MVRSFLLIVLCGSLFVTCATAQQKEQTANPPDKYDVLQYATEDSRYNKYLVTIESYTTNGSTYHKKYLQYLYGIAKIFVDEKKIAVGEHSIGFYYDKKENRKDKLYLGVDLILPDEMVSQEASYDKNARALIGKNLREMMSVLSSCTEVLKENEVKGVVVGLVWKRNGLRELVNIWISKDDVDLFYRNELTLNELVIRSTVTNTDGRIIRMTL